VETTDSRSSWRAGVMYVAMVLAFVLLFSLLVTGRAEAGRAFSILIWGSFVALSAAVALFAVAAISLWMALIRHLDAQYPRSFTGGFAAATGTICIGLLGAYSWVALKSLIWLKRAIQGWAAIVGPWVVRLPGTLAESWTAIFLVVVKIVVLILACWGLFSYTRKALRSWHRAVRLLGLRAALHGAGVMSKLRYREPFRYMRANAPGLSMTFPALLAVIVLSQDWLSLFSISLLVLVALWFGVIWPSIGLVPPVVLWLSASGYDNFRVLKKLQPILPNMVKTLINQASPSISEKYYGHYMRLLAVRRETAQGVSKLGAAVAPMFMNPSGPRLESFRTRPGLWQQSVRDLIEVSPIVIIDTRYASGPVEEEVAWMLDPRRSFRAIWLGNPDSSYPALEAVLAGTDRLGLIKCNEKLLYDLVQDMTQSAETLPRRGGIDWARRIELVTAELDGLLAKIRDKTVPSDLLDGLIGEWDKKHATASHGNTLMPRFSTSLDAALELIKRHLPDSSLTIRIFTNDTGEVEIGVADSVGEFQVYVSSKEYQLIPARAALEALLKAERGDVRAPDVN
jgi:hypothetical protein